MLVSCSSLYLLYCTIPNYFYITPSWLELILAFLDVCIVWRDATRCRVFAAGLARFRHTNTAHILRNGSVKPLCAYSLLD